MLRQCLRLFTVAGLAAGLAACAVPQPTGKGLPSGGGGSGTPGQPGISGGSDPARFKGLAAAEVTGTLGDPNYRRREAPAEVWQYYGQGCVLDLFLYDEKDGKKVSHAELRSRVPGQLPDAECLPKLLAGQRGGASS